MRRVRGLVLLVWGLSVVPAWGQAVSLSAAVLPGSRSVQVNEPATAFATIVTAGTGTATSCGIQLVTNVPADFLYQTTNPVTNQLTGSPNTPVNIPAGGLQTFLIALTPTGAFSPTDVQFSFDCTNTDPAGVILGVNTLLFSASTTPVPDVVAIAVTGSGDGVLHIPGASGTGAFAVAAVNMGAGGTLTVSTDTGGALLPVAIFVCPTDAQGNCTQPLAATVTMPISGGQTLTFTVVVQGHGVVSFNPAANRVFLRFRAFGGIPRGITSVAVRTD